MSYALALPGYHSAMWSSLWNVIWMNESQSVDSSVLLYVLVPFPFMFMFLWSPLLLFKVPLKYDLFKEDIWKSLWRIIDFFSLGYFCAKQLLRWFPVQFSSVQSLSRVRLFATPWTAACQASLSITNSWSLLKLMPIK